MEEPFVVHPLSFNESIQENIEHKMDSISVVLNFEKPISFLGTQKETQNVLIQVFNHFGWTHVKSFENWIKQKDTIWTSDNQGIQAECQYTFSSLKNWKFYFQRQNEKLILKFKDGIFFYVYCTVGDEFAIFIWFIDGDNHKHCFFEGTKLWIVEYFTKWLNLPQIKPIPLNNNCHHFQFHDMMYNHLRFGNIEFDFLENKEWTRIYKKPFSALKTEFLIPKRTKWIKIQKNYFQGSTFENKSSHDLEVLLRTNSLKNQKIGSIIYFDKKFSFFRPFLLLGEEINLSFINDTMGICPQDADYILIVSEWIFQALELKELPNEHQHIQGKNLCSWIESKFEKEMDKKPNVKPLLLFCLLCNYFDQFMTQYNQLDMFSLPGFDDQNFKNLGRLLHFYCLYQSKVNTMYSFKESQVYEMIQISNFIHHSILSMVANPDPWIPFIFSKLQLPPCQIYNPFQFSHLKQISNIIDQVQFFDSEHQVLLLHNLPTNFKCEEETEYCNFNDTIYSHPTQRKIVKYKNDYRIEYKLWFQICGNGQFTSEKQKFEKSKIQSYSKETISSNNYEYHKIDGEGKNEHLVLLEGKSNSSIHGFDAYKLCKTTPSGDMKNGKLCVVVGRVPSHALMACDSKMSKIRVSEFIPKDIIELDIKVNQNDKQEYEFETLSKDDIISKDITLNGKCFYCVENDSNQYAEPCGHEIGCLSCTIQLFQNCEAKCPYCRKTIANVIQKQPSITSKRSLVHHEKAYSFISDQVQEYKVGIPVVIKDFDPKLSTVCTNGVHCHKNLSEIYEWIPFGMIPSELVHEQIFDSKNLLLLKKE